MIRHQKGSETNVRFYDCLEVDLDSETKVIPINERQFEHYSKLRIEKEISLLNQVTVAFSNKTNAFMLGKCIKCSLFLFSHQIVSPLGTIKKRTGLGHTYTIEWHDGHGRRWI